MSCVARDLFNCNSVVPYFSHPTTLTLVNTVSNSSISFFLPQDCYLAHPKDILFVSLGVKATDFPRFFLFLITNRLFLLTHMRQVGAMTCFKAILEIPQLKMSYMLLNSCMIVDVFRATSWAVRTRCAGISATIEFRTNSQDPKTLE